MSLLKKIKESALGLGGADIPIRDGKEETKITLESPLGLKGQKPEVTYSDVVKGMDVAASVSPDDTTN
tara:strand:+ start:293 stop:496 length:204 start_codon:yes stop_codon:yes gene_type:complete